MTGLGPGLAAIVSAAGQSSRPYLDLALRCAQWIDASAQRSPAGLAWPADPLKPASIDLDYYNGTPGVVAFFAQMWAATGDAKWRDRAQQGGAYLVAESARVADSLDAGLYTGLAGLGATYLTLDALKVGPEWAGAATQAAKDLDSPREDGWRRGRMVGIERHHQRHGRHRALPAGRRGHVEGCGARRSRRARRTPAARDRRARGRRADVASRVDPFARTIRTSRTARRASRTFWRRCISAPGKGPFSTAPLRA